MAIKLEITDPQLLTQDDILNTANYLLSLKGLKLTAFAQQKTEANQRPVAAPALSPFVPPPAIPPEAPESPVTKDYANAQANPVPPIPPAFNPFAKTSEPAPVPYTPPAAAPTEAPAPYVASEDRDSVGMPWDKRIHSRTKSLTSDGKWRYQRGIGDAVIAGVEAEIKQAIGYRLPQAPPVHTPVAPAIPAPETAAIPPIPAPVPHAEYDFPYFMDRVGHLVHNKIMTQAEVNEVLVVFGVPSIPVLPTMPDAITKICNRINEIAASRGA